MNSLLNHSAGNSLSNDASAGLVLEMEGRRIDRSTEEAAALSGRTVFGPIDRWLTPPANFCRPSGPNLRRPTGPNFRLPSGPTPLKPSDGPEGQWKLAGGEAQRNHRKPASSPGPALEGRRIDRSTRGGFLLLETMVGVAVFALGVLVLARCMNHCIDAEIIKTQDQRARLVLENRMAEVEGGAVTVDDTARDEKLEGRFQGITLRQSRQKLELTNENDEALTGLYAVTLQAIWTAPQGEQSKELRFYVFSAE